MELMMAMAASSLISGGIGAIGSYFGSRTQADAYGQAAGVMQSTVAKLADMFNMTRADIMNLFQQGKIGLDPFIQAGSGVLDTLKGLLVPGPDQSRILEKTPGYQFALSQGLIGVGNAASVRGLGGNFARDASKFATGLAQQTWGDEVSKLQAFAQMGETAAGQEAALAGSAESALGSAATGFGGAIGTASAGLANTIAGKGTALGAGDVQMANALGSGIGNAGLYAAFGKMASAANPTAASSTTGSNPYGTPPPSVMEGGIWDRTVA